MVPPLVGTSIVITLTSFWLGPFADFIQNVDKSFFCKWQDQATLIQRTRLRDNVPACMYPPLDIEEHICTIDT